MNWANEVGSKIIKEIKIEIQPLISQTHKICLKCNQKFTYEKRDEEEKICFIKKR